MRFPIFTFLSLSILTSCQTVFIGDAYVKDGVTGCKRKCSQWGLELSAMVAMGEYSNGCVCRKSSPKTDSEAMLDASAVEGAIAGVAKQMQQEEEMRRSQMKFESTPKF